MKYQQIAAEIIPISKLLGNYNIREFIKQAHYIIPISKLLGNYNHGRSIKLKGTSHSLGAIYFKH